MSSFFIGFRLGEINLGGKGKAAGYDWATLGSTLACQATDEEEMDCEG